VRHQAQLSSWDYRTDIYWNCNCRRKPLKFTCAQMLAMSQIIDRPSLHGTVALPVPADTPLTSSEEQTTTSHKAADWLTCPQRRLHMLLNPGSSQTKRMTQPQGHLPLALVRLNRAEQFSARTKAKAARGLKARQLSAVPRIRSWRILCRRSLRSPSVERNPPIAMQPV